MSTPIGEPVKLDPERVREHEGRFTGGQPATVVLPKRLDPGDPEKLLAGLAGKAGEEALAVCEDRIQAAYLEARRWEAIKAQLERVIRQAQ